jgi:hypothetical protein
MPDEIQQFSLPLFPPPEFIEWYGARHPEKRRGALEPETLDAWMEVTAWARESAVPAPYLAPIWDEIA